ncbi:EamA family transporter [Calidifontibacter terrae]
MQFGGALAVRLIPTVGPTGAVTLRIVLSAIALVAVVRPRWRGRSAADWRAVTSYAAALVVMNLSFYEAIARLPMGVAVTIEFVGPLLLAAALSRRAWDWLAIGAAAIGVLLISGALTQPWSTLDHVGIAFALIAGACWALYIVTSGRTGARFEQLDGLAIALTLGAIALLPLGIATSGGALVRGWAPVQGLGVALLSSLIPYSLELIALRRMAASTFGVLLSIEPAVAAIAALVVLGQTLDGRQVVGMALVVAASAVVLGASRRHG